MKKSPVLPILVALLAATPGTAAAGPGPAAARIAAAVDRLRAESPGLRLLWDDGAPGPRHLSGFRTRRLAAAPIDAARRFFAEHEGLLGLDASTELVPLRTLRHEGADFVRLGRRVAGLPIYGADLVVRVVDGRVTLVNGGLGGAGRLGNLVDRIGEGGARAAVESALGSGTLGRARLYAVRRADTTLATWVVDARSAEPFGLWRYFVDAGTGAVRYRLSTLRSVAGNVYEISPAAPAGADPIEAELLGLTSATQLSGEFAEVKKLSFDSDFRPTTVRNARPDADGNYLFSPSDPDIDDPFAEVQMYFHIDRVYRHFHDTMGFTRPRADQSIQGIVNLVFSGRSFANAFFGDIDQNGIGELNFGQARRDFAYDADVIYHEFTHSVVEDTAGLAGLNIDTLGLYIEPGSLNEAMADYFSTSLTGDPHLGEYVGASLGGGRSIRDLDGANACPEDLIGEIHEDGVIWGAATWAVREALVARLGAEAGVALSDDVVFGTLLALNDDSGFAQAAQTIIDEATRLGGQVAGDEVRTIMQARGVVGCGRVVPLRPDGGEENQRFGFTFGQQTFGAPGALLPGPMQYRIDVPTDAGRLTLSIESFGQSGGAAIHRLLVRKAETVVVGLDASGDDFAYTADVTGGPNAAVTLDVAEADAARKLEPGASYFVLVANGGDDDGVYTLGAALTASIGPAAAPDDGPVLEPEGEAGDDAGGCAAGGAPGSGAEALALALVAALAARRRRR